MHNRIHFIYRNADNRFDSHDSSIENQNTNHHDYSNAKRLCRNHGFNASKYITDNENKIRIISFIDSGFEKQTWLIIESNG